MPRKRSFRWRRGKKASTQGKQNCLRFLNRRQNCFARRATSTVIAAGGSTKAVAINAVLLHLVADDALGGVEQFGGAGAVAACCFQHVLNQVLFVSADCGVE